MNNNISGSAASWIKHEEPTVVTERSNKVVSYTDVISQLNDLHTMLIAKYETKPNKNVYDSLVSVERAIDALLLN